MYQVIEIETEKIVGEFESEHLAREFSENYKIRTYITLS